jgi:phage terminase large subunit-like protein
MWWEELTTMAAGKRGRRFVVWAFDPTPSQELVAGLRGALGRGKFNGFSEQPPNKVALEGVNTRWEAIDPRRLLKDRRFAKASGLGQGLFEEDRLLGAAALELGPRKLSGLLLRFDHSNLAARTAVVLHGAQWDETGRSEGGMTVVAMAPKRP